VLSVGGVQPGDAPSWNAAISFTSAYIEAVWKALVAALLISAALQAFVPRTWLLRLLNRRGRVTSALAGGFCGRGGVLLVIPTAGEIPILQGLAIAGVAAGPIGALLITLPAVSLPGTAMVGRTRMENHCRDGRHGCRRGPSRSGPAHRAVTSCWPSPASSPRRTWSDLLWPGASPIDGQATGCVHRALSEPDFSATDRTADVAEDEEHHSDDQQDPTEVVEQTQSGQISDDEQYQAKDDHFRPSLRGTLNARR
jgi:hypothetical protein